MSKNVLIIDDNDKNRKLVKVILESEGYSTVEAENGKLGVDKAVEIKPDLIIMDVQMPVMDGVTASKELRSNEATKDIPIIMLTSYAMMGDRERLTAEGSVDDYITKPISLDPFLEAVRKYL